MIEPWRMTLTIRKISEGPGWGWSSDYDSGIAASPNACAQAAFRLYAARLKLDASESTVRITKTTERAAEFEELANILTAHSPSERLAEEL